MLPPVASPPFSAQEPVTDVLHEVPVTDPYRWLEDQDSPRTRDWIDSQVRFARAYLDKLPGRGVIRKRVQELIDVETYDSLLIAGERYFFRKRLVKQEQACIYMRDVNSLEDQLLVDPRARGDGKHTAVRPVQVSLDGQLLLYEVKEGGQKAGTFELLEIQTKTPLTDSLPCGYLRGFAFAPDSKSFYYVHEALHDTRPSHRAVYRHVLGMPLTEDQEIFLAPNYAKVRLGLTSDRERMAFFVHRFLETTLTDIFLHSFASSTSPQPLLKDVDFLFGLRLVDGKIFAVTDRAAANRRIVEILIRKNAVLEWRDVVPETDAPIHNWLAVRNRIFVSYLKTGAYEIHMFDFRGNPLGKLPPAREAETLRMIGASPHGDHLFIESESFVQPVTMFRQSTRDHKRTLWAKKAVPFASESYACNQEWFASRDGTQVPIYLVGRPDVLSGSNSPTIMTSYGGYGIPMTPQFSILVAYLMERGCLFALPNIRGGSEFGLTWHDAAKRRNRQNAYDDFLQAGQWLLDTGRTAQGRLAVFGGSNSGLLVGVAITQRPDLFRCALCLAPILDMLRYHLFDSAYIWKDELGTSEDKDDFAALVKYSPYHHVRHGTAYPAILIVSGDADQTCNPLHARKMTARLQAANCSNRPILLDYSPHRGHSPVLPLSERIDALTDRLAFLCDQLGLPL